jgi:hypothetical protein
MNRLEAEFQRLYLPSAPEHLDPAGPATQVRAMVLDLAGPSAWGTLAKVWQGVQADLQLPAPGIAVNGSDGYQLWFSLAEPVPAADAVFLLNALVRRYLAEVAPGRIRTSPSDPASAGPQLLASAPPIQTATDRWSAFVTPDLAAVFADEPWLDLPPSADAQADVLSRLQSTRPVEWKQAVERLRPADRPGPHAPQAAPAPATAPHQDPRRFLLAVMNDPAIELRLRIEAAKALLPFTEGRPNP